MSRLEKVKKGKYYKIYQLNLDSEIKRRLMVLGVLKGTEIYILNKKNNGDVIIKTKGIRIGVDGQISKNIFVYEKKISSINRGGKNYEYCFYR
jgi:Fe2+ transport system protein FeoA